MERDKWNLLLSNDFSDITVPVVPLTADESFFTQVFQRCGLLEKDSSVASVKYELSAKQGLMSALYFF